ncbi:MAG TPA: ATP-binding protein, partial [Acidimicrobiia bacterium]
DVAVAGRAVADVAHLVAELLENSTSFSPPDSAVVVSGAVTATGFVLAVSDQGIGMPVERIEEANQLLARPPLVGLALSRALGLHVVGSLAARHQITVELRPGAPLGLVALVTLPQSVLEPRATVAPQAPAFAPEVDQDGAPTPLGARRVVWRPDDEPPVEEWKREGMGRAEPDSPMEEPSSSPPPAEQVPLATRVPGQHLSHQPSAEAADADADDEADPLRPYRVHELLTRHAQGKRRGRSERDGAPNGAVMHDSETSAPDLPGSELDGPPLGGPSQEDTR